MPTVTFSPMRTTVSLFLDDKIIFKFQSLIRVWILLLKAYMALIDFIIHRICYSVLLDHPMLNSRKETTISPGIWNLYTFIYVDNSVVRACKTRKFFSIFQKLTRTGLFRRIKCKIFLVSTDLIIQLSVHWTSCWEINTYTYIRVTSEQILINVIISAFTPKAINGQKSNGWDDYRKCTKHSFGSLFIG